MLAIVDGRPEVLGLKGILGHCIDFQYEINTRKYNTLLAKDKEQKEIKEGLIEACDIIDLIIEVIRGSRNIGQARACLTHGETKDIKFKSKESEKEAKKLCFTERQAQAILDLRLAKLIGLEIEQLKEEYQKLIKEIAEFEKILSDKNAMKKVIIKDLEAIKKEYGFERKTEIVDAEAAVYEEEKVKEQEVVFLMDRFGYTKLIEPAAYERNVETIDSENKYILRCMNTDKICIFTQNGMVHQVKVLKVPMKKPKDKGVPIDNLSNYSSANEDIIQICPLAQLKMYMMLFTTKKGMMKFVDATEFDITRQTAAATKLAEGDEVVSIELFDATRQKVYDGADETEEAPVAITGGFDDGISEYIDPEDDQLTFEFIDINDGTSSIVGFDEEEEAAEKEKPEAKEKFVTSKMVVLQTKEGVFLRFKLNEVPEKKKGAIGVRGIKLGKDDEIDKVYIVGFGDKTAIKFHNKDVELMKLKLAKRDTKGTKLRL